MCIVSVCESVFSVLVNYIYSRNGHMISLTYVFDFWQHPPRKLRKSGRSETNRIRYQTESNRQTECKYWLSSNSLRRPVGGHALSCPGWFSRQS